MIRSNHFAPSLFLALAAVFLIVSLNGCGYKDNPLPPQQVVPRPIGDLRYQLTDKGVSLSWSYPTQTVTGDDISEISSFDIYRAVVPSEDYCEGCPIPFAAPVNIPGGSVPDEGRKTATYDSTLLRPGNMYSFKVRSNAGWWAQSQDSNIVSFLWNIPAKAPENLQAQAGDGVISLQWQPVTSHRDGSEISEKILYKVYRSLGGGQFQPLGDPVDGAGFTDKTVNNGRKYFYKVQSLSVYDQATVGGGESEIVTAVAIDRTPPVHPAGVRVVRTAKTIKIFWEPVEEKDLKGYRVYRRLDGEQPVMVGEVNAPYVVFTDHAPPDKGVRVFYSVSSFDNQEPANESVRSPEVMIKD